MQNAWWMRPWPWLAFGVAVSLARAEDWPEFRGPNQDGSSLVGSVPQRWSERENVRWRTSLPGKGWSTPVVRQGRIWVTAAVEAAPRDDAERAQLLAGEDPRFVRSRQAAKRVALKVLELDLTGGEVLREVELFAVERPDSIHALNSYASPSPVVEEGRLYADFGALGTAAVDTESGAVLWRRVLPADHSVGPGSSPVLADRLLVLVRDGVDAQYVEALDKETGKTAWKKDRPAMDAPDGEQKKSFCTPLLIEREGSRELVIPGAQWIVAYEPETGEERWRVRHGKGFSLVPRPVYGCGLVFVCTGFGKPQLWAIRPGGRGDVTETHVVWKETKRIPKKPSPLLAGDQLYVLEDDGGVLTCFAAETGEIRWSERLGGNYSASPVLAAGRILLCSQEGDCHLIRAGGGYEVLATNHLEGQIMASPVPLEGGWLVRTTEALYRIGS